MFFRDLSVVEQCRMILNSAGHANSNDALLKVAAPGRVEFLLAQLNAHKCRDAVYNRDEMAVDSAAR